MAGMSVTKSWLSVSVCLRTFLSFWHQVTTLAHCGLVTPQYKTYKILINIVSGNDLLFAWHQTFDKPYLNQCWLIVNYTLRNKLKRNFMQNSNTLQWRHNEHNNVSIVCSTFGSGADQRKLQRSASLAFCAGNLTSEFPTQKANNTENVYIWWRHHDFHKKMHLEICLLQNFVQASMCLMYL